MYPLSTCVLNVNRLLPAPSPSSPDTSPLSTSDLALLVTSCIYLRPVTSRFFLLHLPLPSNCASCLSIHFFSPIKQYLPRKMNCNNTSKTAPSLRFHQLPVSSGFSNQRVHSSHLLQGTSGAHSSVSNSYRYSTSITSRFTRSVDNQLAYSLVFNSWDTLSAGIADKIRSGSIRCDRRYVIHLPSVYLTCHSIHCSTLATIEAVICLTPNLQM